MRCWQFFGLETRPGDAVQDAVARRYQPPSSSGTCPSEAHCDRFQSAAGATSEDKQHACTACELLPTKLVNLAPSDDAQQWLWIIERLASERDSGGRLQLEAISPLEWELLMIWDGETAMWERAQQQRLSAVVEALLRRGF